MIYLFIGSLPPPLGGVSVYLSRLKQRLEARGHRVNCLRWFDWCWVHRLAALTVARFRRVDSIEVHVYDPLLLFLLTLAGMAGRTAITFHNDRNIDAATPFQLGVLRRFAKKCRRIDYTGDNLPPYYEAKGIIARRTRVKSPFLPPDQSQEVAIRESYATGTRTFLQQRSPVIVANGFRLGFYQGVDLYGLDMCINLLVRLRTRWPNVGLIFGLSEPGDAAYLNDSLQRIEGLGLAPHFHLMMGQKQLWPLFRSADLMVRPTASDSFGISVAEAIWAGCPAVASNVCRRAVGTILFRSRDMDDFVEKCEAVLSGC